MKPTYSELAAALSALADAADIYAADQADAPDPRVGMVQPVTVAEAEQLNAALRVAWATLERMDYETAGQD